MQRLGDDLPVSGTVRVVVRQDDDARTAQGFGVADDPLLRPHRGSGRCQPQRGQRVGVLLALADVDRPAGLDGRQDFRQAIEDAPDAAQGIDPSSSLGGPPLGKALRLVAHDLEQQQARFIRVVVGLGDPARVPGREGGRRGLGGRAAPTGKNIQRFGEVQPFLAAQEVKDIAADVAAPAETVPKAGVRVEGEAVTLAPMQGTLPPVFPADKVQRAVLAVEVGPAACHARQHVVFLHRGSFGKR